MPATSGMGGINRPLQALPQSPFLELGPLLPWQSEAGEQLGSSLPLPVLGPSWATPQHSICRGTECNADSTALHQWGYISTLCTLGCGAAQGSSWQRYSSNLLHVQLAPISPKISKCCQCLLCTTQTLSRDSTT